MTKLAKDQITNRKDFSDLFPDFDVHVFGRYGRINKSEIRVIHPNVYHGRDVIEKRQCQLETIVPPKDDLYLRYAMYDVGVKDGRYEITFVDKPEYHERGDQFKVLRKTRFGFVNVGKFTSDLLFVIGLGTILGLAILLM
jgi:hypothetical protein